MKPLQKFFSSGTALALLLNLCPVVASAETVKTNSSDSEVTIVLSDSVITVDGEAAGTDSSDAVYLSNDIIYYEDRDYYDSGNVYGEGTDEDKHTAEEAEAHTVVNITEAGTYRISGTLSLGQIAIDLGDDAKTDPTAVVTLILDGVDITCEVAPAVIFYSVYECDTDWVAYDEEEAESYTASADQDTSAAGANVILADGSVNNVNGSYVAKIYKDNGNAKKLYKFDGAFYSKMSLNIDGETEGTGVLNIVAENEGLDTEMHLSINGGVVNIQSQDDGINTNEDNVSVTTINGGTLHIVAGLGSEGDGIDSNGYLVINGGVVISTANPASDSGLDSDCGSYINGGTVLATGSTMDWADSESGQVTINLQFAEAQDADEAIIVTDLEGNVVFAYDPDKDETTGSYNRSYQGAILSCSAFAVGDSYYIYVGGDVTGTEVNGLYDASTVTGFTGAARQIYTGMDVGTGGDMGGGPGGDFGGGPAGDFGGGPGGDEGGTTQSNNVFYMTDMVNAFSGVQDDDTYEGGDEGGGNEGGGNEDGDEGGDNGGDEDGNIPEILQSSFTDVESGSYYEAAVNWAVALGITNGTIETTFSPYNICTRAQAVTFLYRAAGSPSVEGLENPFTDVSESEYYYNAVLWA
ncbi:MAG: carbohydrate-binding domain-containing protein, partial [Oscillospiraceae bacterium]|nr:carbohydrate-binding domain-containing protein [Oscillospiraceae bacterium]